MSKAEFSSEEEASLCNDLSTINVDDDAVIQSPCIDVKTFVKKGDVLLTSIPFAHIVKGNLRQIHCDHCFRKRQSAQRCSGCASIYYCNRECQKNSWPFHKKECSKLKKFQKNLPPDTVRLMARVILKLQDGGHDVEELIHVGRSRKFEDLMTHYEDLKKDEFRLDHFSSLLVVLNQFLGEESFPSEELLRIYGKVLVNGFSITDKDLNVVGTGIYLAASIVDHSCKPNAYASFIGTEIHIRALQDMEMDWSKVRISYLDVLNTTKKRKEELEKGYFFTCDCSHCTDDDREQIMSTINCGNSECSNPIYISEDEDLEIPIDECSECKFCEFEPNTKKRYLEVLKLTLTKLEEMGDKNYFDTSKFLVEQQAGLFHRLNLWRVKSLDVAFESAIDMGSWDLALSYGCQNIEGMKFYYGANHPMFGMVLLKLGKIELYLFRFQEALEHLEEAEPILKITHGTEHPLYSDDLAPLLKQARQEIKMIQFNGFNVSKSSKNEIKRTFS